MHIYLDESGDLGWSFDKAYQRGGSSRYLTITATFIPPELDQYPERVMRGLYKHFGWKPSKEKKWSDLGLANRKHFAHSAAALLRKHPAIRCKSIVVTKENVFPHLREDSNLLYNYMTKLLLVDDMCQHSAVKLVPDPRSIKIKSGNSLKEYLQTTLWYEKQVPTRLTYQPIDSKQSLNLQFTDMVAGATSANFEFGQGEAFHLLRPYVPIIRLFPLRDNQITFR